MKDYFPIR